MAGIGNYNPIGVQYTDYCGHTKSIRLFSGELTAVSLPGFLTQMGTLTAALDAVTLGTRTKESWGEETVVSNTIPTDKQARTESEMLVRVIGATSETPWSFRIPTIDYDAFNYADAPSGDRVILSGAGATAATTALIAAIQAVCKMPDDPTEAVVVVGMVVVR